MRATTKRTSIIIGATLAVLAVLFIVGSALQRQDQDGAASPGCCASDGAPDDGAQVGDPPGGWGDGRRSIGGRGAG